MDILNVVHFQFTEHLGRCEHSKIIYTYTRNDQKQHLCRYIKSMFFYTYIQYQQLTIFIFTNSGCQNNGHRRHQYFEHQMAPGINDFNDLNLQYLIEKTILVILLLQDTIYIIQVSQLPEQGHLLKCCSEGPSTERIVVDRFSKSVNSNQFEDTLNLKFIL